MIQVGRINKLKVKQKADDGFIVADILDTEFRLPSALLSDKPAIGSDLDLFVWQNKSGERIASQIMPKIMLGDFASLTMVSKTPFYALMDIGLGAYQLEIPLSEQSPNMEVGKDFVVHYLFDENRNAYIGTCKLDDYLEDANDSGLSAGEEVTIIPYKYTEIGVNVVVNSRYAGLLYQNEIFDDLQLGLPRKAFLKKKRDDYKLDISLYAFGYKKIEPNADKIMLKLHEEGGTLHLGDKSEPEAIYLLLSMSKKSFKKAIGLLYKKRLITIDSKSISLVR